MAGPARWLDFNDQTIIDGIGTLCFEEDYLD